MKFNWGTGIFLFYCLFATVLFYAVYRSTQFDHSLVADNYYEKDLAYQSMFEKKENSLRLENGLIIRYDADHQQLSLHFPTHLGTVSGEVLFYKADDQAKDRLLTIQTGESNVMRIPVGELFSGIWKVEVDWKAQGRAYFDEKVLSI